MSSPWCIYCEAFDEKSCTCIEDEIAALKAELEDAKRENYANEFNFEHSKRKDVEQQLTRERERNAVLREALEDVKLQAETAADTPRSGLVYIVKVCNKALLAASDEGKEG